LCWRQPFFTAEDVRSFRMLGLDPSRLHHFLSGFNSTSHHDGMQPSGFKDESELAFEDNVKHSFFLYPDEMVRIYFPRSLLPKCLSELIFIFCYEK
jgi:ATP-dependent DNA helicase 2 subunit 1